MKKIRNIIIIILTIIIIIISIIMYLKVKETLDEKKLDEIGDIGEEINYDSNEIIDVEDSFDFYTVRDCINKYYNVINSLNNINIKPKVENKQEEKSYGIFENAFDDIKEQFESDENIIEENNIEENGLKQNILELLDSEYIEYNKITTDNLQQYLYNEQKYIKYEPLKMKVLKKYNTDKYIVYGFIIDYDTYDFLKYEYLIVNLDNVNKTFSIEPINNGNYNDINEINIKNEDKKVNRNNNNQFSNVQVNNEYLIRQYINIYKEMIMASPQLAYEYLDKEYKEKRFGNIEEYIKYIQTNKDELSQLEIVKYSVDNYSDRKRYISRDLYNNYYIINEKKPMQFTLMLDTYTIKDKTFIEEYNKSKNQNKVMMNTDKWFQMLNNRDYKTAYSVLDENYRNNTFGSEEQFESAIREKLPLHYEEKYSNFSEQKDIYSIDVDLTDVTGESKEQKQMTIVMQLKDDLDFVMSFSFKEE